MQLSIFFSFLVFRLGEDMNIQTQQPRSRYPLVFSSRNSSHCRLSKKVRTANGNEHSRKAATFKKKGCVLHVETNTARRQREDVTIAMADPHYLNHHILLLPSFAHTDEASRRFQTSLNLDSP